jgi:thioredoxin 1
LNRLKNSVVQWNHVHLFVEDGDDDRQINISVGHSTKICKLNKYLCVNHENNKKMRMSFKLGLLTMAFAMITSVSCQNKAEAGHDEPITVQSFDATIGGNKLVMVDFYTTWCGPCKKMAPFVQQICENRSKDVIVLKVDAEAQATIADRYRLEGYPTVMFFKNGQVIGRALGYQTYENLSGFVDRFK